jgi:hypothetical protein
MSEQNSGPGALRIIRAHVYYDPQSGDIVHVHRIAVPAGEELDEERIAEEVAIFEGSLVRQHGRVLPRIETDDAVLREAMAPGASLRVDLTEARLVR